MKLEFVKEADRAATHETAQEACELLARYLALSTTLPGGHQYSIRQSITGRWYAKRDGAGTVLVARYLAHFED